MPPLSGLKNSNSIFYQDAALSGLKNTISSIYQVAVTLPLADRFEAL
jgi:hypothetical protein